VDNIKMDLGDLEWGGVDWIGLTLDMDKWRAVVNAVRNFRVPQNAVNFRNGFTTIGFPRSSQLHIVSLNK
jgi:hypothetical protein